MQLLHKCLLSVALLSSILIPRPALSQAVSPEPKIVSPINALQLVSLNGSVPSAAKPEYDRGAADASTPLTNVRLLLARSPQQKEALDLYLGQLQDHSSPNYHRWLTPEQFGARFGAAESDIATIRAWLESQGLTVTEVNKARSHIAFSGTAAQISTALHTPIHVFEGTGGRFYSNTMDVKIPSALAPAIEGIAHLNTIQPHPLFVRSRSGLLNHTSGRLESISELRPEGPQPNLTGGSGTSGNPYFLFLVPGDAATIYDTPNSTFNANYTSGTSYTGSGVTIGIIGNALVDPAVAQTFRKTFVGDTAAPSIVNVDGVTRTDNTYAISEAYLDVETAGGLAPGANIRFYTSKDFIGAVNRAVNDNQVDIISVSFGLCEQQLTTADNAQYLNLWKQAAAQGIAVTVSAGDTGSAGCDPMNNSSGQRIPDATAGLQVSGFASTPYNIAVGGLDFAASALGNNYSTYADTSLGTAQNLYRTAKQYIPESTWNDSVTQNLTLDNNVPVTGVDSFGNSLANILSGSGGPSRCSVNTTPVTTSGLTGLGACTSGYTKPSWQRGAGVPSDGARDIPDISLMAGIGGGHAAWLVCDDSVYVSTSNGYVKADCTVQSDGNFYFISTGGTSAAAPAFAGILAITQQKTGGRLGQAAQQLYALYNGSHASEIFHDITVGNNAVPCTNSTPNCTQNTAGNWFEPGYDTTTGYDLASGLGSIDAKNLAAYWDTATSASTAVVTVTPAASSVLTTAPLRVDVAVSSTSGPTPTGTVELSSGGYKSTPQTLSSGSYSFTVPAGSLTQGSHALVVSYSGDSNYDPGLSSNVTVQVNGLQSILTIAPSSSTIQANQILQVEVQLSGSQGTPSGTITLSGFGTQTLVNGKVKFTIAANTLSVGSHTLSFTYSGDAIYAQGSGSVSVTVNAASTLPPSVIGPVVNQVVTGAAHSCALTAISVSGGEAILCWGSNNHGQLGDGTTTDHIIPITIDSTSYLINQQDLSVVSLASGDNHTCAMLPAYEGPVCWGANTSGQLGNGSTTDSAVPVRVSSLDQNSIEVAAGSAFSCALRNDGLVSCWGDNTHGQLGDGSTNSSSSAVKVSGLSGVVSLAASGSHACALLDTGLVKCWGDNSSGELGDGATTDRTQPVTVSGIGGNVTSLALGHDHSCALLDSGAIQCWGGNSNGQLGAGTAASSTPVTVSAVSGTATTLSAGANHTCATFTDGSLQCWGSNLHGQLGPNLSTVGGIAVGSAAGTFGAVSAGAEHTCATSPQGLLSCWGENDKGQLGNGTVAAAGMQTPLAVAGLATAPNSIAAGSSMACAVVGGGSGNIISGGSTTAGGTAFCWGLNSSGQLGDGTNHASNAPVAVSGLQGKTAAVYPSDGGAFACALLTDSSAACWGYNIYGVLGNGTMTPSNIPVAVSGLTSVKGLSVGGRHVCALLTDSTVRCWGSNDSGQLGNGTTTNSATPVTVNGLSGAVTAVAASGGHSCALIQDGTVQCWGSNTVSSSMTPMTVSGLTGVRAISAASNYTCALLSDGTVSCWGYGPLGNGSTTSVTPVQATGISGAKTLSTGSASACVALQDGTARCWGDNSSGQLGNGSTTSSATPVTPTGLSDVTTLSVGSSSVLVMLSSGTVQGWGSGQSLGFTSGMSNIPLPVFYGQSINFTPPSSITSNSKTDLLQTTTVTGNTRPEFDTWSYENCEIDYDSNNTNLSVLVGKSTGLCGLRAIQRGDNSGSNGSFVAAPSQLRVLRVGATVPAPKVVLTPGSLDFGNVNVGTTSAAQTFTLSNTGNAPLSINSIGVTGANANLFQQTNDCGTTTPIGGTCTISITFSPTATGNFTALLSISDNAIGTPHNSALSGNGATPSSALSATLTPPSADFGKVNTGASSTPQSFSLTNTGTTTLTITSVAITGTNAASFKIGANACGNTLAAGANCAISITFSPTAAGAASATLQVADDAGTQTSNLLGTGSITATPQAVLSPANASFGGVTVGVSSSPKSFTLANGGTAALTIASFGISGANASMFQISSNTCGQTLATSHSCEIGITFRPTSTGNASATLSVIDSDGTQTANLDGAGLASAQTDFSISATPTEQSIRAGSNASYSIQVLSADPAHPFTNSVSLTASGLPPGATVSFAPATLAPGTSQPTTSTMTITTKSINISRLRNITHPFGALPKTLALASLLLLWPLRRSRFATRLFVLLLASLAASTALSGCSSQTGFGLPLVTNSTITVTATSGSIVHTTTVTLKVN